MFSVPASSLTREMTRRASAAVRSGYRGAPLTGSRRTVPPMRATPAAAVARFSAPMASCFSADSPSMPVAVKGVECRAAEAFADSCDDVDVVQEFRGAGGPGDQAAVSAGHVAGVEVQAGELDAGVGDGVPKAVTWASVGTEFSKGHQNSTASKPAAFAAAGRSSRGSSVRRMEQFTEYVIVGSFGLCTGSGPVFPGVLLIFPYCGNYILLCEKSRL